MKAISKKREDGKDGINTKNSWILIPAAFAGTLLVAFMLIYPLLKKDALNIPVSTTELFSNQTISTLDDSTNLINQMVTEVIEFEFRLIARDILAIQEDFHNFYQDTVVVNRKKFIYSYTTTNDEFHAALLLSDLQNNFRLWGHSDGKFYVELNGKKIRTVPIKSDINLIKNVRNGIERRVGK